MMMLQYTVERIDDGVEVRLCRAHVTRCRVWMCDELAGKFLEGVTDVAEAKMREQIREEYDRVIARLVALMRAVMAGQPGGTIDVPDDVAVHFPFFN